MTSFTNKTNTMTEANKPQASTPNFVLTLLAACSNSVLAAGHEGEAKFCEQLCGLLQDKEIAVEELNLIYNYKFGFSIKDALKFMGFEGTLQEFLSEQKRFSVHEGFISLKPVDLATIDKAPSVDEPGMPQKPMVAKNEAPADDEVATPEDCALAKALDFGAKSVHDDGDDNISNADTDCTSDAESSPSDADSDVDLPSWNSLGHRLIGALGSCKAENSREADVDGVRWKVLGSRIASALNSDDSDDGGDVADVAAWGDVGNRMAAACKHSFDDECDASGWHSVGTRLLQSLGSPEPEADAEAWRCVGSRIGSRLDSLHVETEDM